MANPAKPEESEWTPRGKATVVLITVVLLGLGLVLAVGGIVVKATSSAKADRLRADGVAVTATLQDFQTQNKSSWANVELWYVHEGKQYHPRIGCSREPDCDPATHPTVELRIDPAKPTEFVAPNGATDDSRHFLNSWKGIIFGVFFTLLGILGVWVRRHIDHPVRGKARPA
jgi:hypothetical protein